MQLDAVFASEIMCTDVVNVRRWKHRSKMVDFKQRQLVDFNIVDCSGVTGCRFRNASANKISVARSLDLLS